MLRRSHSEETFLSAPGKAFGPVKRRRGEVKIRIVDFAHTTTGRDYLPYPEDHELDPSQLQEVTSGKGYQADVDPESGLIFARFPPHYPDQPDRGFLFGLKNIADSLVRIWDEERLRRMKLSRDDPSAVESQLPPVNTEGKQIFDMIFGSVESGEFDPGYLST